MNLNIKSSHWFVLFAAAILGSYLWLALALPRYQMIDLSVDHEEALEVAQTFLNQKLGIDVHGYKRATVFTVDETSDRYLQKTLGVTAAKTFIDKFKYDLFFWDIRFFKEKQKEEFH